MRRNPYLLALLLLLATLLLSLAIGSVFIPLDELWKILRGMGEATFTLIVWQIRLPRTVLIALAGAALGGSGAAYQGLFRNPLADPYLIGVASGAGLGAVIAMSIKWPYSFWGLMAIPMAAFLAALLTVFIVYSLARVGQTVPTTNLILAGVAFSSFATSLTSFLMLRSTGEVRRALGWLLGGISLTGWDSVLALLPYLTIGMGLLLVSGHALNLMQFGDDQAQQLGLNVTRSRVIILVAASLIRGHHRIHRFGRAAHRPHVVRRGLPAHHPAVPVGRRVCLADLGRDRARRACPAGDSRGHRHRAGGRAVLFVGAAPREESGVLVIGKW
jgi:iron complex transport system permease protein